MEAYAPREPENRRVATVALNILYGAAVLTRARILNAQGLGVAPGLPRLVPLDLTEIENRFESEAGKASVADYIRLLQLERELDEHEGPREIKVTWVETKRSSTDK